MPFDMLHVIARENEHVCCPGVPTASLVSLLSIHTRTCGVIGGWQKEQLTMRVVRVLADFLNFFAVRPWPSFHVDVCR